MLDFNPMNEFENEGKSEAGSNTSNPTPEENLNFDLPVNQSSVIKVIGVGGGGSNAVNYMYSQGIHGVDFIVCNTDHQALQNSPVPNKVQLGVHLTEGLGAGADPAVGEEAAKESVEEVRSILEGRTKMLFITAGMGGGTGTGAAPIIARTAREMEILTVGIVTIPFQFEGKMRLEQAEKGVEALRENVDSLIVINNNKLRDVYGNLGFKAGFSKADEVLAIAAKGIAEVITHHFTANIDLRDAQTVLKNSGTAIMGSARSSGSGRAEEAVKKALDSPLLNDNRITGAKNVLLLIISGREEITIDEIGEISDHIQREAGGSANIIMGIGEDESLQDEISVTVVATGFKCADSVRVVTKEPAKIVHVLEEEDAVTRSLDVTESPIVEESIPEAVVESSQEEEALEVNAEAMELDSEEMDEEVHFEIGLFAGDDWSGANHMDMVGESADDGMEMKAEDEADEVIVHELQLEDDSEGDHNAFTFTTDDDGADEEESSELMEFVIRNEAEGDAQDEFEKELILGSVERSVEDEEEELPELTLRVEEETIGEKTIISVPREEVRDEVEEDVGTARMRRMTEERKSRLKDFNYKFRNTPNGLENFENIPAYKRRNIDLENTPDSSDEPISRFTLGDDDSGETNLRSRNSFLHDNVD
jgi:cell division protein FtsZ